MYRCVELRWRLLVRCVMSRTDVTAGHLCGDRRMAPNEVRVYSVIQVVCLICPTRGCMFAPPFFGGGAAVRTVTASG